MNSKIVLGIFIIIAVILSAGIVSAADLNGTEVDEIEDHRFSDSDMEKINREYEVFEANYNEESHFENFYLVGSDNTGRSYYNVNISIKSNNYHEDTIELYYKKGENTPYKTIDRGSKDFNNLELGYNILDIIHSYNENDHRSYKKVCVILHGSTIINTDEPVYKTLTLNTNKNVLSHYKKVPHYKTFKSWDFAKSPKKLKSMIKRRCRDGDFECCAMGTSKLVKFYQKQLYKNGVKLVKFKIKRLNKYKYSSQHGYKVAKFKFNVKVKYYTLKPIYKTVTVKSTSNVFSHYKKIGEIW